MVEEARQGERLEEDVKDAATKVDLLNGEIAFNHSLGAILERLQAIQQTLELVLRASLDDSLVNAVELFCKAVGDLAALPFTGSTRISSVLEAKVIDLRSHLEGKLTECWNSHIIINPSEGSIRLCQNGEGVLKPLFFPRLSADLPSGPSVHLDSLIVALRKLNALDELLQSFCYSFESLILSPRLQVRPDGVINRLDVQGDEIRILGDSTDLSAEALFQDLDLIVGFLRTQLPPSLRGSAIQFLMPRLISKLITTWLASAVPEDLEGMEDFEDTVSLVGRFGQRLDTYQWPGSHELLKWKQSISSIWLRKREEISLDKVRKLLYRGPGDGERVERVETQIISRNDEVFPSSVDWDAGWSDEEKSPTVSKDPPTAAKPAVGHDEEDVSAWGLNDDEDTTTTEDRAEPSGVADDDGEAWGWGDENEDAVKSRQTSPSTQKTKTNGIPQTAQQAEREVTLRETYNITSLPKEILEIISQVISDAVRLETPDYASLPIASAASDLLRLPGLILAMYRASSSTSYSRHPSGQMFLYNDSVWLAERLHHLHSDHATPLGRKIPTRTTYNLKLKENTSALESFSKRVYTKEMESQRTIIADLLDGAQGFVHCTEHPFAGEIDLAIASTIDRLRLLYRDWKDVLSHSALLQSIGSLLSTVIDKIIVDIEDMPDISEAESKQLATYCNRIATLEDLFRPVQESPNHAQSSDQEAVPITPLYTSHWLKFQYLANILESSLIDIKYLWTEGELGLEFDTEELVDLIVALFADSQHRRTAVAEIRGRRGVR